MNLMGSTYDNRNRFLMDWVIRVCTHHTILRGTFIKEKIKTSLLIWRVFLRLELAQTVSPRDVPSPLNSLDKNVALVLSTFFHYRRFCTLVHPNENTLSVCSLSDLPQ